MSTTIPSPTQQEPRTAYKPKRSRKAPAIQSAVLAKRSNGESKRKISKDLDIAYNTVTNVLELNNFDEQFSKLQSESMGLVQKSIKVFHDKLDKGSESAAKTTLENTIWPLNGKASRGMKPGDQLFLSIQNLIQPSPAKPLESVTDITIIPPKE